MQEEKRRKKKAQLIMGELIGREVEVKKSTDSNKEKITGKIIDETKNTVKIETKKGKEKTIPKKTSKFKFTINNQKITIKGKKIKHRPEDRIKKNWRKYNDLYR